MLRSSSRPGARHLRRGQVDVSPITPLGCRMCPPSPPWAAFLHALLPPCQLPAFRLEHRARRCGSCLGPELRPTDLAALVVGPLLHPWSNRTDRTRGEQGAQVGDQLAASTSSFTIAHRAAATRQHAMNRGLLRSTALTQRPPHHHGRRQLQRRREEDAFSNQRMLQRGMPLLAPYIQGSPLPLEREPMQLQQLPLPWFCTVPPATNSHPPPPPAAPGLVSARLTCRTQPAVEGSGGWHLLELWSRACCGSPQHVQPGRL